MKTPSLRRFLASALILLAGPAASAAPIGELRYHEPAKGALVPNEPVSYSVAAKAQDFLGFEIRTTEAAAVARILDESGKLIRGSAIDMEGGVSFAAPAAGSYCLELTSQKATGYHIVWVRRVPLEERIRSRAKFAAIGGPRIEALRIDIVAGRAGAVAAFWDEVRIKGAPLIEALPGDPGHMTVTFLWKGTAATRRVLLLWPAQNRLTPGACSFSRLGDTDVWFATVKVNRSKRALYRLVENGPDLPPPQEQEMSDAMGMIWAMSQRDPLNPRPIEYIENKCDPPEFQGSSTLEMPDAPAQPLLVRRAGVPAGRISTFQISSVIMKDERKITVVTPPGYSPDGEPYGAIYLMDGDDYIERMHVDALLDNLLAEHRLPPFVAVLVNNAPGARNDLFHPSFSDFLARELAPRIRREYHVTADPRRILIGGKSLGGLAAMNAAYWFPDTFGNVLSQSGGPTRPAERQFGESVRLPVRFYMSAGTDETDRGGLLASNRRLRQILLKKGYEVHYDEVDGGHDLLDWRMTLPRGLLALAAPAPAQVPAKPVPIAMDTGLGSFTIMVDLARAPITGANFLRYVDQGFFDGGLVTRAVRPDNTRRHDTEIQVIQAQENPARTAKLFPPIPLERTSVTGLRHVDGVISMSRDGPDTAQAAFFITIGSQPELDSGGRRNPDRQGFAAFGRVVAGMDVVRRIQASHTATKGEFGTETMDPPIRILKARRQAP